MKIFLRRSALEHFQFWDFLCIHHRAENIGAFYVYTTTQSVTLRRKILVCLCIHRRTVAPRARKFFVLFFWYVSNLSAKHGGNFY